LARRSAYAITGPLEIFRARGAARRAHHFHAKRPTQTSGLFHGCSGTCRSAAGIAADDWQHLAGDVARAGPRCEKNKGGSNLFRLRRASHGGVGAEFLDRFGRLVRRIERPLRVPMRWCRSQKPAKSTASIFPVLAGCHLARAICNALKVKSFDEHRLDDRLTVLITHLYPGSDFPIEFLYGSAHISGRPAVRALAG
jgi:hypothetical protein